MAAGAPCPCCWKRRVSDPYNDLQASYGRCLRTHGFIERFYEIFLATHPEIEAMFARTDFRTQRLALRRGISIAISHAAGMSMVNRNVEDMVKVHSREGRTPVRPALYGYWIDSLIRTIEERDPEVTPELIARWRNAMGVTIEHFSRRY